MKRTTFTRLVTIAALPFSIMACGGGGGGTTSPNNCTAGAGGQTTKYVVSKAYVPTDKSKFAIDVNGDGRPDNQLGNILGALSGQGLNVQEGVKKAIDEGSLIILGTETSSDASFTADTCAGFTIELGSLPAGTTVPDYTGNGTFMAGGEKSDVFAGPITNGKFSSAFPTTTKTPANVTIALPLIPMATPVTLKITAGQVTFARDSKGDLTGAELHGVIKDEDVRGKIIPNVAELLTTQINTPGSSTGADISRLFDNGGKDEPPECAKGCKTGVAARPCALATDKIIDVCEVATSNLISNVLAPDVQMFDAAGNYAPNKANTTKDSLSLGLQFDMVPAKF